MQYIKEILSHSNLKMYKSKKEILLDDLIKEIDLNNKFFVILINGQRVKSTKNIKLSTDDEILILPKIAGGK